MINLETLVTRTWYLHSDPAKPRLGIMGRSDDAQVTWLSWFRRDHINRVRRMSPGTNETTRWLRRMVRGSHIQDVPRGAP